VTVLSAPTSGDTTAGPRPRPPRPAPPPGGGPAGACAIAIDAVSAIANPSIAVRFIITHLDRIDMDLKL
jgi:hypothetical protein